MQKQPARILFRAASLHFYSGTLSRFGETIEPMPHPLTDDQWMDFNFTASKFRGVYLNSFTRLERYIDYYLADYFCGDSKSKVDMIELLLSTDRISMKTKFDILFEVLPIRNPEVLESHPDLKSEIIELNRHRNILAHQILNSTVDAQVYYLSTKAVSFVKLSRGNKSEEYTGDKIKELIAKIEKYAQVFGKFVME